ncbi:MAG: DNA polymerase III subunit delta [Burkholderiales bacterium]|nr:DNA polymerase III subunit delta [Burkholderiales bacterium]
MNLDSEQLARHLERQLAPLYLVYGEEALLALEAADRIRGAARHKGYSEREVLIAEPGFEWRRLQASGASLSLFATQRLIEVRIPGSGPGVEGAEALANHAANLPPDTLTLITVGKLDGRARKSAWFTALEAAGVAVHAQKVTMDRLPQWLAGRLGAQGHQVDEPTLEYLAARVEGNLMAAHQEVQKLALLFPPGRIQLADIKSAVLDVARYDAFDLGPAVLKGEAGHFARMLDGLEAEGAGPPLVLWALAEEARALLTIRAATARGVPSQQALRDARVWGERQGPIQQALRRLDTQALEPMLEHAARIDRIAKGVAPGAVWDELRTLGLTLAGAAPEPR